MRVIFRFPVGLWVFVASVLLSNWWQMNPDAPPNLPQYIWDWLVKIYDAKNADQGSDLVAIVGFLGSLVVVSLLTWLALFLCSRFFKSARSVNKNDVMHYPDGAISFKVFRKDPKDEGRWTLVSDYSGIRFKDKDDALVEAAAKVP